MLLLCFKTKTSDARSPTDSPLRHQTGCRYAPRAVCFLRGAGRADAVMDVALFTWIIRAPEPKDHHLKFKVLGPLNRTKNRSSSFHSRTSKRSAPLSIAGRHSAHEMIIRRQMVLVWMPQALKLLCLTQVGRIPFSPIFSLPLSGVIRIGLSSIKMWKMENLGNKIGLTGCKLSSLNAPGTQTLVSHSGWENSISHFQPLGYSESPKQVSGRIFGPKLGRNCFGKNYGFRWWKEYSLIAEYSVKLLNIRQ